MVTFGFHLSARAVGVHTRNASTLTQWASLVTRSGPADEINPQIQVFGQISQNPGSPRKLLLTRRYELTDLLEGLVGGYWGRYLAVAKAPDEGAIAVLPDPTGTLDVFYFVGRDRVEVADSLAELISAVGNTPRANLTFVGDIAFALDRYGPASPIDGIQRIPFGHALIIPEIGAPHLLRLWPRFCADTVMSLQDASDQLISILQQVCVAMALPKTGLLLSGGRDSSLIAGILGRIAPTHGLNICHAHIGNENIGMENEIAFARQVAERVGGAFYVISDSNYKSGFSLQIEPCETLADYPPDQTDTQLAQITKADVFLDGRGGDAVFLEEMKAGHISEIPARDVLRLDLGGGNFGKLLYSKVVVKSAPVRYLASRRDIFASSFLETGLLTDHGKDALLASRNLSFYRNDVRYFTSQTRIDKASYLASVLTDMVYQNARMGRLLDLQFPLIAQPVLDFVFSLDLRILMGSGNRTLQRAMLRTLGLNEVAQRDSKTGVTSTVMEHLSRNEPQLIRALCESPLVLAGYIDLAKVSEVFTAYHFGVSHQGGQGVYRLLQHALLMRGLKV
jgi:hypothetical protein